MSHHITASLPRVIGGSAHIGGGLRAVRLAVLRRIEIAPQTVIDHIADDHLRRVVAALLFARFQVVGSLDRTIGADQSFVANG